LLSIIYMVMVMNYTPITWWTTHCYQIYTNSLSNCDFFFVMFFMDDWKFYWFIDFICV